MPGNFVGFELFLAVFASRHFVELLLMLFLEVDIVHFATLGTFLDVSATVPKMGCDLRFRESFLAVVTNFAELLTHV